MDGIIWRFPDQQQPLHHMAGSFLWLWSRKHSRTQKLLWWGRWKLPLHQKLLFSMSGNLEGFHWKWSYNGCGRHSSRNPPASTPQQWRKISCYETHQKNVQVKIHCKMWTLNAGVEVKIKIQSAIIWTSMLSQLNRSIWHGSFLWYVISHTSRLRKGWLPRLLTLQDSMASRNRSIGLLPL